jgi:hypothetical protein
MKTEKTFFEELARTPELPPYLYNNIKHAIGRRTMFMRTVVSLAATVVLAVGITAMFFSPDRGGESISAEVASELQAIKDFGNGSDIPKDLEAYTFYEGELSY